MKNVIRHYLTLLKWCIMHPLFLIAHSTNVFFLNKRKRKKNSLFPFTWIIVEQFLSVYQNECHHTTIVYTFLSAYLMKNYVHWDFILITCIRCISNVSICQNEWFSMFHLRAHDWWINSEIQQFDMEIMKL